MKKVKIQAKSYLLSNVENQELINLFIEIGKKYDIDYYKFALLIYKDNYKYKLIANRYNLSESYIKRINDDILLITIAYLYLKKRG